MKITNDNIKQANTNVAIEDSVAFGSANTITQINSLSSGFGNNVDSPYSIAVGYENTVGSSPSSGAFGQGNYVFGGLSFAFGYSNSITSDQSFTTGVYNAATAPYCFATGYHTAASATMAFAGGSYANANHYAEWARSSSPNPNFSQYGSLSFNLNTQTTGVYEMFLDTLNARFTIDVDEAYSVRIYALAKSGTNVRSWKGEGIVLNNSGTVSFVSTIPMLSTVGTGINSGAAMEISADTVNGSLQILVSGETSPINWTCRIDYEKLFS